MFKTIGLKRAQMVCFRDLSLMIIPNENISLQDFLYLSRISKLTGVKSSY